MVAPGFLNNPEVTYRLDGVEPAWTLLTFESMNALRQEPSSENRALTLTNNLTGVEIAQSAVARNALILLHVVATASVKAAVRPLREPWCR